MPGTAMLCSWSRRTTDHVIPETMQLQTVPSCRALSLQCSVLWYHMQRWAHLHTHARTAPCGLAVVPQYKMNIGDSLPVSIHLKTVQRE